MTAGPRQKLISQVHIAKRDLCLDDNAYRAMLKAATNKTSCADMDITELQNALAYLKQQHGWHPHRKRHYSPKSSGRRPPANKLRALWINLYKQNLIHNGSERALGNYCHRIAGKHSPDWLTHKEARLVIESLKQWEKRLRRQQHNRAE